MKSSHEAFQDVCGLKAGCVLRNGNYLSSKSESPSATDFFPFIIIWSAM